VTQLETTASDLVCTLSQLAIAWKARNPRVSTIVNGASKLSQLRDGLGAVDIIAKLTPEVMARIDKITAPLAN
jgi:aryl-alcohol dehydrogenase-like predicted oxidoreductase